MSRQFSPPYFPLVSVVIPAYNAEAFITRTLHSVLSQSYKNLEVLVVDDGSQDRTVEIVQSLARRDERVILLRQKNSGVAVARNLAIQNARGELIAPIDADDIWYPQNLEKQVQCLLQAEPSVGLSYAWSVDINEDDVLTGEFRASKIQGEVYKTLICHNFLGNSSASLIRRACFEKVGGYSVQLKEQNAQGCEDWELYLRIAECYQFRVVPEFLIGYRKIQSSMSRDYTKMAKSHELMLQAVRQNYPEIPGALYRLSKSSFYLYLARQSHQSNHNSTLFWLYKAVRTDLTTPFLRFSWYVLLIQSFFGSLTSPVVSRIGSELHFPSQFKPGVSLGQRAIAIADLQKQHRKIYVKVLLENVLHQLILMVLKSPETQTHRHRLKSTEASASKPFVAH
jgi:glycosyltransferase involved in cell wall biosynthesis